MNLEIWIYAREEEGNETVTWLELSKFCIFSNSFLPILYIFKHDKLYYTNFNKILSEC
jgi:hypothetical protein